MSRHAINPFTRWFDEVQVGDRWRSRDRTVTRTDVDVYRGLSGDDRWGPSPPGGADDVVPEFLVLALGSALVQPASYSTAVGLYGNDDMTWHHDAHVNDTLHVEIEIIDLESRDDVGGVVTVWERIVDHADRVVAEGMLRTMVRHRPPGDPA